MSQQQDTNAEAEQEIFCFAFHREKTTKCVWGVLKQELSIASTDSTESPVVVK